MVRGRYRVGVSKTKTKEKIMMKKKVMPLSCLMAAAMLAGCGTAAPAVPEETTAPAVETAEAAQETAPADAAESEAAAVEKTAGVWQVEPCYNFDEIVPLYSEWDHTAGKNAADGLYAVRDGERWSLFSTKTGNIMMQDAAQQMPYLYGTNELSVWLDDEYYNYDNFAAMREKCEGLNAELQANGAEIEVLYDGVGGYANRWIYTEDGQIYYDLLGTYEFSGTPLVQRVLTPSEKARSISHKYALAGRKKRSRNGVRKSKYEQIGEEYNLSARQIARYVRLGSLDGSLLTLLDGGKLPLTTALRLVDFPAESQKYLAAHHADELAGPKMARLTAAMTPEQMDAALQAEPQTVRVSVTVPAALEEDFRRMAEEWLHTHR